MTLVGKQCKLLENENYQDGQTDDTDVTLVKEIILASAEGDLSKTYVGGDISETCCRNESMCWVFMCGAGRYNTQMHSHGPSRNEPVDQLFILAPVELPGRCVIGCVLTSGFIYKSTVVPARYRAL